MWAFKTENIKIDSACAGLAVSGSLLWCESVQPKAILQIVHGMCEYSARYDDFARFMAQNGYVVCRHDHLGHGETSNLPGGEDGFFGSGNGREYLLDDIHSFNELARAAFPKLPVILLGHSMGSFFARWFAERYPDALDALLLSGTAGGNPFAGIGLALTKCIETLQGPHTRPALVQNIAFGGYLKKVTAPNTPYDWISRDSEIVATYAKDPKCTFVFTVTAFHEMFWVLRQVNRPDWFRTISQKLPVRIFSGDADPVGNYGKGVQNVYRQLLATGHDNTQIRLYPGGRHEMLNEINRDEVYRDVLSLCKELVNENRKTETC